jgi:hypothetical protein
MRPHTVRKGLRMKPKAKARGEIVAWDLVVLGKIDAS